MWPSDPTVIMGTTTVGCSVTMRRTCNRARFFARRPTAEGQPGQAGIMAAAAFGAAAWGRRLTATATSTSPPAMTNSTPATWITAIHCSSSAFPTTRWSSWIGFHLMIRPTCSQMPWTRGGRAGRDPQHKLARRDWQDRNGVPDQSSASRRFCQFLQRYQHRARVLGSIAYPLHYWPEPGLLERANE